jgi:hypothetical protein
MNLEIGLVPMVLLRTTAAWADLDSPERLEWLENKRAALLEYQVQPNGVFWVDGRSENAGDMIMMLWNLVDQDSVDALVNLMRADDVRAYFEVTVHGGTVATDQEAIYQPFLKRA